MTELHARYMRHALDLAERGWGRVQPNPLVGAVIVQDGAIVGEGIHREFGGAHAEIEALAAAGEAARGATLYVTLEPCSHQGKTPPCCDAIVRAGVATVVFGASDANPAAAGGAEVLRRAGINVVGGIEADAVERQNAIFFHQLSHDTPFVAIKFAMSLDGRIARAQGERTKLTSAPADQEVHRLRSGFDAILIGSNTARVDDPLLTVRHAPAPVRPPVRVVLDSSATVPISSALLQSVAQAPVWIVCTSDVKVTRIREIERTGARVLVIEGGNSRPDVEVVLRQLREEGIGSVLCEGGSALAGSLLVADVVERLYAFLAPVLLGEKAVPAFPVAEPGPGPGWRTARIAQVGNDALLMLERVRPEQREA